VTMRVTGPTAALAGIPSGLQGQGPWVGRRQLFVRFAGEAETATMYTAQALANELRRATSRSVYHSLSVGGRDTLGNGEVIAAALQALGASLPVLLDTDGQRPEALADVQTLVSLLQVTVDFTTADSATDRALQTIRAAADAGCQHALVLAPGPTTSDGQILRLVEQAHATSAGTIIVVHPAPDGDRGILDVRWPVLMERAVALHPDSRLLMRLPPPTGMR
jgi:hypothetical protein